MTLRDLDRRRLLGLSAAGAALATSTAPGLALARTATRTAASDALEFPIRLNGNENPWGPGPAARAAIAASTAEGCRYGMAAEAELSEAIAANEGLDRDRIAIGSGSGELLHVLALAFCDRGQIVCAWPTFAQITAYAEKLGCEVRRVPLDRELRHDLRALADAVTPNASLLYVCNPNNPTGTAVPAEPLRAFVREMSQRTLVVLDEAYLELAAEGATASMVDLVREGHNVVVLRTFSKIHGLAGMRVGYALARPDLIQRIRRYTMTIPSTLSLRAAKASLGDAPFLARVRERVSADRARIHALCDELGLGYAASEGNFSFVDVRMPAEDFRKRMEAERILVGRGFEPLRNWSRISVGTTAETSALIEAMRRVLKA